MEFITFKVTNCKIKIGKQKIIKIKNKLKLCVINNEQIKKKKCSWYDTSEWSSGILSDFLQLRAWNGDFLEYGCRFEKKKATISKNKCRSPTHPSAVPKILLIMLFFNRCNGKMRFWGGGMNDGRILYFMISVFNLGQSSHSLFSFSTFLSSFSSSSYKRKPKINFCINKTFKKLPTPALSRKSFWTSDTLLLLFILSISESSLFCP